VRAVLGRRAHTTRKLLLVRLRAQSRHAAPGSPVPSRGPPARLKVNDSLRR
jgi:hypothetical protein